MSFGSKEHLRCQGPLGESGFTRHCRVSFGFVTVCVYGERERERAKKKKAKLKSEDSS